MKRLTARQKWIAWSALALVAWAAWVGLRLSSSGERLKYCGHPDPLSDRLQQSFGFRLSGFHGCTAGKLVSQMKYARVAVEMYQDEHEGALPTSIAGLTNDLDSFILSFNPTFASEGQRWWIAVSKQERLPGHYLITSEGAVHFNREKPATTNDVNLRGL